MYDPLAQTHEEPLTPEVYAAREMQILSLLNRMTVNGWKVDEEELDRRVEHEDAKRLTAVEKLREVYGVPTHTPDRYKLKLKRDWPAAMSGLSITEARETMKANGPKAVSFGLAELIPGERRKSPWVSEEGRAAIIAALGKAGATKAALLAAYQAAETQAEKRRIQEFGLACLDPGAPADAPVYPKTAPSGSNPEGLLAVGKDVLGSNPDMPTWYCEKRRQAYPTMLALFGHIPAVRDLVETLLEATGARTKFAEMKKFVTKHGRIHAQLGAPQASGRFPFKNPSLTNVGARGEAIEERDVLVADEGMVQLSCDISGADIRAIAAHSQDPTLIEMLQPGKDMHTEMAGIYFGDPSRRKDGKPITLGIPYGMGAAAIALRNNIDRKMVDDALTSMDQRMPVRSQWIVKTREAAESGVLDNGFGRKMRLNPRQAYTQGPALMGQGAARDLLCESMLRADALARLDGKDIRPYLRMTVHDELDVCVPKEEAEYWQDLLKRAFTWEWKGVPILCEVSDPAYRWSECK